MKILPVSDPSFQNYGQVLTGYDLSELLATLDKVTPCPDGVDYVPEQAELQALPIEKGRPWTRSPPARTAWTMCRNRLNCRPCPSRRNCATVPTAACPSRSAGATATTRR